MYKPKLFIEIKTYSLEKFIKDLTAGFIVGIIALPLSIALAIASGVAPEKGLHTAIIAGFLISFLGGSNVQIGGPTGAFVVIVSSIIAQYGFNGLITATVLAGIFLIIMGLLKFGTMIKYIPYPITTGFTSGIAVTIFSSQLKDLFGLQIEKVPAEFLEKYESYFHHIGTFNWQAVLIGLISITIIALTPRFLKKIPGSLIAIIITTAIINIFKMDVATIGSVFGKISSAFPSFSIPAFDFEQIKNLVPPAFTIAVLAGIESLLSAVVADGMAGTKHNSNTELIGQGVANTIGGLFGCIPATGAIARTAANIKNGGGTPVAGMVHSLTLLVIMLIFMPFASLIPMPALAGILVVVAYNMSEWRVFAGLFKGPKSDIAILLTTFFITVLFDLVYAIGIGMVLSAFLFLKRMSDVVDIKLMSTAEEESSYHEKDKHLVIPVGIQVYEIDGPFFFGAADKFATTDSALQRSANQLILVMNKVPVMDATAMTALEILYKKCKKEDILLKLVGVRAQPMRLIAKNGFAGRIGCENICESMESALYGELVLRGD